jgi:predicted N-acetyltransferase YhbS
MSEEQFGLPKDLGDGLTLRWAVPEDAEALAAFNVRIHSDNPEQPETWLGDWTRELMNGRHPTTTASDFTIVTNEAGEIVSSMNLISQTWAYEGIEFGLGRPELVGTDAAYRRRGLVRRQFEAVHAKSAAKGELAQAITGIPWYYRKFGYAMTLEFAGSRGFRWDRPGNFVPAEPERYQLRPAEVADIPVLMRLYGRFAGMIHCARDAQQWQYELFDRHRATPYALDIQVVLDEAENVIGYVEYKQWGTSFTTLELAVLPGHSLREVALCITRALKVKADALNAKREQPIDQIRFSFGSQSPVYDALGQQLKDGRPPYAYFMRVPDMPAFLRRIQPVLEQRLADSTLAGHTGRLRLNFYTDFVQLLFEKGQIMEISPYTPTSFDSPEDGDIFFPELTFLHVLFGQRSYEEVRHMWVDCFATNATAPILVNVLFPQRPSWVRPLG